MSDAGPIPASTPESCSSLPPGRARGVSGPGECGDGPGGEAGSEADPGGAEEPAQPPSSAAWRSASSSGPQPDEQPQPGPNPQPPAHPPVGLCVHLQLQTPDRDPPIVGWLEDHLARAAGLAGRDGAKEAAGGTLGVTLVDDAAMARLHARYKNDPSTTDVLSFDYRDPPPACQGAGPGENLTAACDAVDGDLVICMDEAARQARARGRDTRLEVLLYAVHGLLHLLGEDDRTDAGYARMHRREDRLLEQLGVGPLFAPAPAGSFASGRRARGEGVGR